MYDDRQCNRDREPYLGPKTTKSVTAHFLSSIEVAPFVFSFINMDATFGPSSWIICTVVYSPFQRQ